MLINVPNIFIVRGGDGSGRTELANKIAERYTSAGYFNTSTREELDQLECVIISCDLLYLGLFGPPIDLLNLQQFKNSEIFYSELIDEIEICIKKSNIITIVIEGILCYTYLDVLNNCLKDKATVLNIESVGNFYYSEGLCVGKDDKSLSQEKLYPYSKSTTLFKEILIGRERLEMYRGAYQFFPEFLYQTKFYSNSPEKLALLNLPNISGKRILDVGSNLGYFVFKYKELGALADGVDSDRELIVKASKFRNIMYSMNGVNFYHSDIIKFSEKKYDIVSFLSGMHLFEKPRFVLEKIHAILNVGGILLLETGLSSEKEGVEYFEEAVLDSGAFLFPNLTALQNLIAGLFEITFMGRSVEISGNYITHKIFHLRKT